MIVLISLALLILAVSSSLAVAVDSMKPLRYASFWTSSVADADFVTGRLDDNTLVHFRSDRDVIGTMVQVKITDNKTFYLIGERI